MMKWSDALQIVVEGIAASPKLSAGVSLTTASLGVASATEVFSGLLSSLAIVGGLVVTFLLGRVHWETHKNLKLQHKMLRHQLEAAGLDPDEEDAA